MNVIMVGTPDCINCKKSKSVIEEYCATRDIGFEYYNIFESPTAVQEIIRIKRINKAPVLLIYREGKDTVVLSGDDVFMDLEYL